MGVHVEVPDQNNRPDRASELSTTFLPSWEVPNTVAATSDETEELTNLVVDMGMLADPQVPVVELQSWLRPLAAGYKQWLGGLAESVEEDEALQDHRDAALDALDDADEVATAIAAGINLLGNDADALAAFRFANATMRDQRLRTEAVRRLKESPDDDFDALVAVLARTGVPRCGSARQGSKCSTSLTTASS